MTQATSALKSFDIRTDSSGIENILYSKNIFSEDKVKSAIRKVDDDLERRPIFSEKSPLLEKSQEAPVVIRKHFELKENYRLLQQWEGVVLEVYEDYFIARLHDLTGKYPDEEAEFSFEEISENDKELLEPGAFFYWNIGYHESKSGQRTRSSIIRFRRLPAWTKKEIESSKKRAEDICAKLKWGTNESAIQREANKL